MRDAGSDRGAQTFAHVDDGIEEHAVFDPGNLVEPGPRVVDASQECDGHDDDGEDQADLPGVDRGADDQAQRACEQTGEHEDQCEQEPTGHVRDDGLGGNVVGHGDDEQSGDDALHGGEADLFQSDGPKG